MRVTDVAGRGDFLLFLLFEPLRLLVLEPTDRALSDEVEPPPSRLILRCAEEPPPADLAGDCIGSGDGTSVSVEEGGIFEATSTLLVSD